MNTLALVSSNHHRVVCMYVHDARYITACFFVLGVLHKARISEVPLIDQAKISDDFQCGCRRHGATTTRF